MGPWRGRGQNVGRPSVPVSFAEKRLVDGPDLFFVHNILCFMAYRHTKDWYDADRDRYEMEVCACI
jgi:hypothetical protein